jgi:catechol 2,3-dioxygenase-like lactoylglutathione lyase family enzyme
MNVVIENFDACVSHMRELFGAEFLHDLPGPNWHACLMELGNVIIEFFAPPAFMLSSRHGPHYLGVEYMADIEEARAAVASHGLRIMRDLSVAFHTNPRDGFGADYEFFGESFHTNEGGHLTHELKPLSYWRDEHPLGCIGQKGYTHAVGDIAAASAFLQSFLGAKPVYETERPHLAAHAIGLEVSDDIVELLTPSGEGLLRKDMYRAGEGIRSMVFRVRDIEQARRYLEGRKVRLIQGTDPAGFAIAPEDNLGILFEFAE